MRLWLLIPGSIILICGILMMFSIAFSFVLGAFHKGGEISVSIWHLIIPLIPTVIGLTMVLLAPRDGPSA